MIQQKLAPAFIDDFGVKLKRFDLSAIEPDKESEGDVYKRQELATLAKAKSLTSETMVWKPGMSGWRCV